MGENAIDDHQERFNPRSREGSDDSGTSGSYVVTVSIHAPVKGATWTVSRLRMMCAFQSTLP